VLLVVDASSSLAFGSGARTKAEVAAELCTLLAALAVRSQDRVGLVLATDRVERYVPPGKGPRHLYRVIRELVSHPRSGTGTDLGAALDFARRVAPRHSTVFLVSDFVLPEDTASLERALARTSLRHDLIAISVADPREADLPPVGLLTVEDPETGRTAVVDTDDPAFRQAHRERVAERRAAVLRLLTRHGVDHVPLSTAASTVDPLLRFFQDRARRLR
jgi:uncharacterized protein (DUF58 family)